MHHQHLVEFHNSVGTILARSGYIADFQGVIADGRTAIRGMLIHAGTAKTRVNYQLQNGSPTEDITVDLAQVAVRNLTVLGVA